MHNQHSVFLKKSPFIRITIALIMGIILQWHAGPGAKAWLWTGIISIILTCCFAFTSYFIRFKLGLINGVSITALFISLGGLLTWKQDVRNDLRWFGRFSNNIKGYMVVVDEPLQEKPKTFKATAGVKGVLIGQKWMPASGKIILYFKKDSAELPSFGSKILFQKKVEEIKNSGNPGAFDYKKYGLLHGFTHQVYLQAGEYRFLPSSKNQFREFIYKCQGWLLNILRENIRGEKESGLAEALLIGYKDDLDKSLVQSYSNTGVVHIIAISGLHLGLIYLIISLLTRPLNRPGKLQGFRFLLITTGLWSFTLLAGAQPSILRSATMFTCIAAGELLARKSSVYNSLAFSAFIMLCINPFWLWDLGFQLSYSAVLSIVIFQRPVYNLFYTSNKLLDLIWKLNAVTLAAQILTTPLTIFYFHQFPNFFLLTNFLAVPLSSLILLSEIILCLISFYPLLAEWSGKIISSLIRFMNLFIERIDAIELSVWKGLQLSLLQVLLCYLAIIFFSAWLNNRWRKGLIIGMVMVLGLVVLRSVSFLEAGKQKKLLVYNVPRKQAIDIINGRRYQFIGDQVLNSDPPSRRFYLDPSRIYLRTGAGLLEDKLLIGEGWICINNILVISGNGDKNFLHLADSSIINKIVFDSSVPPWKCRKWKIILDSIGIQNHDVASDGAFMVDLK